MARLTLLVLLGASLISAVNADDAPADQPKPRRPNILWLIADNIGPDLGCYGAPLVRTPRLDRLAATGMRYTAAFSTCLLYTSDAADECVKV